MKSDDKLIRKIEEQQRKVERLQKRLKRAGNGRLRKLREGRLREAMGVLASLRAAYKEEMLRPVIAERAPKGVAQQEKVVLQAEAKKLKARAWKVSQDRKRLKGQLAPEQEGLLKGKEEELKLKAEKAKEGAALADQGIVLRRKEQAHREKGGYSINVEAFASKEASRGTTAVRGETISGSGLEAGPSSKTLFDDTPSYMKETAPDTRPETPFEQVPPVKQAPPEQTLEQSEGGASGASGSSGANGAGGTQPAPSYVAEDTPTPPSAPEEMDLFIESQPEEWTTTYDTMAKDKSLPLLEKGRRYLPWVGAGLFGIWLWKRGRE